MTEQCSLVTRRTFIKGLGAAVLVAGCSNGKQVAVYGQDPTSTTLGAAPSSTTIPPNTFPIVSTRTLVVVELGGGNDGLATVVPHANRLYYDTRRETAVEDSIDLDGEVGLHPALTTVASLYEAGDVAVVEGIGYPDPDLSHFSSMRIWWDGTEQPDSTGWLGRYLDGTAGFDQLLAGVTIGPGPTPAMLGGGSFVVNIFDANGLSPQVPWWVDNRDELIEMWAGFAPVGVPLEELTPIERAIGATVDAGRQLEGGLLPLRQAIDRGAVEGDEYSVIGQLRMAAYLIASDSVDSRVIYVHGNGDFDTHEDQRSRHDELMSELDTGIAEFYRVLDAAGSRQKAVLMTTSEFGRRAADNGTGTDHGTASSHFIIGSAVEGGRYGEPASLQRLDEEENLVHTVDFRSVFATVLDGWLDAPHEDVLHRRYETLPIFG